MFFVLFLASFVFKFPLWMFSDDGISALFCFTIELYLPQFYVSRMMEGQCCVFQVQFGAIMHWQKQVKCCLQPLVFSHTALTLDHQPHWKIVKAIRLYHQWM